jgi:arginine/lysine/ornithine decarboxylase
VPKLPLIEELVKYIDENNSYFAMPGHKMGKGFATVPEGKVILENFLKMDLTEVDGLDNLHNPQGVLKEAQELLSKYYGSKKSYFLVNGSTSGNLAMIFSTFQEGEKVIIERNCHRSIYNSIIMRKLKPIYIKSKVSEVYDAPFSIDREHLFNLMEENKDAKGIVITYPNYYGICTDLKTIIDKAKSYDMKVLIDCAHGAHFGITEELPENPIKLGADMVVQSAHKTLPSLTQTAYLHIGESVDVEKVNFYVSGFLSTSPSYIFMATMDYARFFLEKYGKEVYSKLLCLCNEYMEKINNIKGFHIINKEDLVRESSYSSDLVLLDNTRYVITVPKGYSGHKLLDYLRKVGIQCEMSDSRSVVLIFSPYNDKSDFEKLYTALVNCNLEELKDSYTKILNAKIPTMVKLPHEAFEKEKHLVLIESAKNMICGNAIVPYPPGIPLLMPGEFITREIIDIINYYIENNVTLLGIKDRFITVIKE